MEARDEWRNALQPGNSNKLLSANAVRVNSMMTDELQKSSDFDYIIQDIDV